MCQRVFARGGAVVVAALISFAAVAEAPPGLAQARERLAATGLGWLPNAGQWPEPAAFRARTFAGNTWVLDSGRIVHQFSGPLRVDRVADAPVAIVPARLGGHHVAPSRDPGWVLTETFVTDRTLQRARGVEPQPGSVSYATGAYANASGEAMTAYQALDLGKVFPGIDVRLKATGSNVEKLFTVEPFRDPAAIRIRLDGAIGLHVARDGALEAQTGIGPIRFTAPTAFQTIDGHRRSIDVRYALFDQREYGFALGAYDRNLPLTIDPLLQSTFFGGAENENPFAIAFNVAKNEVYVAGYTESPTLPATAGAEQTANAGPPSSVDGFVVRLNAALTQRLQTTFVGGTGGDTLAAMAIHPVTSDVYIAGYTVSSTLPATAGAAWPMPPGLPDAYVTRLNSALTQRVRTTYYGGTGEDRLNAMTIHPVTGEIILAGSSKSATLPADMGAEQVFNAGLNDGFVARISPDLSQILRSTFIGSTDEDVIAGVAVHPISGEIVVTGYTASTTLPASTYGAQPAKSSGSLNVFITRLDAQLVTRLRTTFFGGNTYEIPYAMDIHPLSGDIYVAGYGFSTTMPGTADSSQPVGGGYFEAFVVRHNATLSQRLQSQFIGGTGEDVLFAMAIDPVTGEVFVAGNSNSPDLIAMTGAIEPTIAGPFISRLNRELTKRVQSTFLGGVNGTIRAMAIHPVSRELYVVGLTGASTFAGTAGAEQTTNAGIGTGDVVVARLTRDLTLVDTTPAPFQFVPQIDVPPSTLRVSAPVQMTGLSGLATIYVDGQQGSQFCVSSTNGCACNVLAYTSAQATVADAQYVCVRHVSAPAPGKVTETTLHVGGEAASFFATTGSVLASPCRLDVDGNNVVHALTDGLMLLRAMFGLTGTAVTNNAIGAGASRSTWAQIQPYLNGNCGTSFGP